MPHPIIATGSFSQKFRSFSWFLLSLVSFLLALGLVLLYSAADGNLEPWAIKQLYSIALFMPVMLLLAFIDINLIYKSSYVLYIIGLALLIVAEILGHKAMGAQRWIRFGVINFQPSELMKVLLILALARYFHDLHLNEIGKVHRLILPTLMVILPVLLILRQPNLGTSTIILLISAAIFFEAGVRAWKFITGIVLALSVMPFAWYLMHDYQRQRVLTFLNPESDPLGAGYNIIQSIIAIGSGGLTGKGLMQGSQSQLSFLPEKQTDFIFTLLAEEFGYLGVLLVLVVSLTLIYTLYKVALHITHQFGRLIVIGMATAFALHIIINACMISGLMPVVGMPFPLLSYGGSNLMFFLIGFGLVLNCKINHEKIS